MLEARDAMQEFLFEAEAAGGGVGITRMGAGTVKFGKREAGEFGGACKISGAPLVIDGELLTGVNRILAVASRLGG